MFYGYLTLLARLLAGAPCGHQVTAQLELIFRLEFLVAQIAQLDTTSLLQARHLVTSVLLDNTSPLLLKLLVLFVLQAHTLLTLV